MRKSAILSLFLFLIFGQAQSQVKKTAYESSSYVEKVGVKQGMNFWFWRQFINPQNSYLQQMEYTLKKEEALNGFTTNGHLIKLKKQRVVIQWTLI